MRTGNSREALQTWAGEKPIGLSLSLEVEMETHLGVFALVGWRLLLVLFALALGAGACGHAAGSLDSGDTSQQHGGGEEVGGLSGGETEELMRIDEVRLLDTGLGDGSLPGVRDAVDLVDFGEEGESVVGDTGGDVSLDASSDDLGCQPECEGLACGDDGCGGQCGFCGEAFVCDTVAGQCEPGGYVAIPGGGFWMGSPDGQCPEGYPGACVPEAGRTTSEKLHYVLLTHDIAVYVHEFTVADLKAAYGGLPPVKTWCGDKHPVSVSWFEALAIANKLSSLAGLEKCYMMTNIHCADGSKVASDEDKCMKFPYGGITVADVKLSDWLESSYNCHGFRLPTEAEFEYYTRAGTLTAFYDELGIDAEHLLCEKPFHLSNIAWYCANWPGECASPVCTKTPNKYSLCDTVGNVQEWIWGSSVAYEDGTPSSPVVNPTSKSFGLPIARGGGILSPAMYCRSASRCCVYDYSLPAGFRLVRTLDL